MKQLYQFDTPEISDALDSLNIEGALLGIKAIQPNIKVIGPAFTIKYLPYLEKPSEFQNAGNYIDDVPENSIILIDNAGREDCTIWGNILTEVALTRNIAGTVIFGAVRDIHAIKLSNYPVYASAIYMRSGKNRVYKSEQQCNLCINGVVIKPQDVVMCDDNGVIIIPKDILSQVIERANNIKKNEKNIIISIQNGSSLKKARNIFKYNQPWISNDKDL